jgi:PAS domain-containing protein
VNGPGLPKSPNIYARKESVINYSLKSIGEETNLNELSISLSTSFNYNAAFGIQNFSDEEIRQVLEQTGKQHKEDQLNCGACGYSSCLDNAKAILSGMVDIESCIPYMRRLAEQRTDKIIETSPNGIVILNKGLEILHMNPAFSKFFMCTNSIIGKRISYLIDPEPFIKLKETEIDQIEETVHHHNYDITCHQILYKLHEEEQYIGIFVDITKNISDAEKLDSFRKKTIQQARELLDHQVEMAQQLAKLLGENTAKGQALVENLLELTQDKQKKNKNWLRDTYTTK